MTAMSENIELMMPIKAAPYDHQKRAFAFACDKFGVFDGRLKSRGTALLMEMGTGKMILSILVDIFSSRILSPMLLFPANHSISVV